MNLVDHNHQQHKQKLSTILYYNELESILKIGIIIEMITRIRFEKIKFS